MFPIPPLHDFFPLSTLVPHTSKKRPQQQNHKRRQTENNKKICGNACHFYFYLTSHTEILFCLGKEHRPSPRATHFVVGGALFGRDACECFIDRRFALQSHRYLSSVSLFFFFLFRRSVTHSLKFPVSLKATHSKLFQEDDNNMTRSGCDIFGALPLIIHVWNGHSLANFDTKDAPVVVPLDVVAMLRNDFSTWSSQEYCFLSLCACRSPEIGCLRPAYTKRRVAPSSHIAPYPFSVWFHENPSFNEKK